MHTVEPPSAPPLSWRWKVATALALSVWIFGFLVIFAWWVLTLVLLPAFPIGASISLAILVALYLAPLDIPPPAFLKRFFRFTMEASFNYYPVTMIYEDKDALHGGRPYIVGYEPHSVLPQGLCAFCEYAVVAPPPGIAGTRILVSSAGFLAPVMRHLWWWLGCRPVSRSEVKRLLSSGQTVALCPGGVRECLYMQPGSEVAYLRKRYGFVRMALEHGAPLVPVFAFGQSDLYSYCRPFLDFPKGIISRGLWGKMARRMGFAPMLVWGVWGTPMPRRVPLTIVVGKPIEVPKIEGPVPPELVEEYLKKFISSLEGLFENHKAKAGYPNEKLTVF